jgi:hypothetical protein
MERILSLLRVVRCTDTLPPEVAVASAPPPPNIVPGTDIPAERHADPVRWLNPVRVENAPGIIGEVLDSIRRMAGYAGEGSQVRASALPRHDERLQRLSVARAAFEVRRMTTEPYVPTGRKTLSPRR